MLVAYSFNGVKENEIVAVIFQLKQLKRRSEKNSGSNEIQTHDLCDSGG